MKLRATYDAHYLALAESFDCELGTADERFYRAASPRVDNVRWLGEFVAPEWRVGLIRMGSALECGFVLLLALLEI